MKMTLTLSKIAFLMLLIAIGMRTNLQAQSLTEAMNKQIWPGAATWSLDAWENLLPGAGQDTVFYPQSASAEVVATDRSGYPIAVIQLRMEDGSWQPSTKTIAQFDDHGSLTQLQAWTYEGGQWVNAAMTEQVIDASRNTASFDMRSWVDGGWQVHSRWSAPELTSAMLTGLAE